MAATIDQSATFVYTGGFAASLRAASNVNVLLATSFSPSYNSQVTRVDIKLFKSGAPSGNLTLSIYSDSAGIPSSSIGSSAVVSTAAVTAVDGASADLITFTFNTPVNISQGSRYWVVLSGDYSFSGANLVNWIISNGSVLASEGENRNDGSAWNSASVNDFYFQEYAQNGGGGLDLTSKMW